VGCAAGMVYLRNFLLYFQGTDMRPQPNFISITLDYRHVGKRSVVVNGIEISTWTITKEDIGKVLHYNLNRRTKA